MFVWCWQNIIYTHKYWSIIHQTYFCDSFSLLSWHKHPISSRAWCGQKAFLTSKRCCWKSAKEDIKNAFQNVVCELSYWDQQLVLYWSSMVHESIELVMFHIVKFGASKQHFLHFLIVKEFRKLEFFPRFILQHELVRPQKNEGFWMGFEVWEFCLSCPGHGQSVQRTPNSQVTPFFPKLRK